MSLFRKSNTGISVYSCQVLRRQTNGKAHVNRFQLITPKNVSGFIYLFSEAVDLSTTIRMNNRVYLLLGNSIQKKITFSCKIYFNYWTV